MARAKLCINLETLKGTFKNKTRPRGTTKQEYYEEINETSQPQNINGITEINAHVGIITKTIINSANKIATRIRNSHN